MTRTDDDADDALEARLARALGPDADDTAPLSQAVLNRCLHPVFCSGFSFWQGALDTRFPRWSWTRSAR